MIITAKSNDIVFSWRVKTKAEKPSLDMSIVHPLTKKKPRRLAATLRDGMMPTVKLSLWVMTQNMVPKKAITIIYVICSYHFEMTFALSQFLFSSSSSSSSSSISRSRSSWSPFSGFLAVEATSRGCCCSFI